MPERPRDPGAARRGGTERRRRATVVGVAPPSDADRHADDYDLGPLAVDDGADVWRLAGAAGGLDVNSSYAYLLLARDFGGAGVAARHRTTGALAGFVVGYLRPDEPNTIFVWQVATAPDHRGRALAATMLEHLADRVGATAMEATVTDDNVASRRLFERFARSRDTTLVVSPLFETHHFPDDHAPERLLRIGPWS